jgi:hypothetical protein
LYSSPKCEENEKCGACGAHGGEEKCVQQVLVDKLEEGDHFEVLDVEKNNIKMDLERMKGRELDLSGSGQGQVGGYCEHGDEHSDYVSCGEFFEWLRTY